MDSPVISLHSDSAKTDIAPTAIVLPMMRSQRSSWRESTPRSAHPTLLFRGWDGRSGGDSRLNSSTTITPRAFLERAHTSVYDMTRAQLATAVMHHLSGYKFPTPFSSWSPQLSVAMAFCKENYDSAYISVIDTERLSEANEVFHVPDLESMVPVARLFSCEYLVRLCLICC